MHESGETTQFRCSACALTFLALDELTNHEAQHNVTPGEQR